MIIATYKDMVGALTFYQAFVQLLLLFCNLGALISQIVGAVYAFLAYREIRDGGVTRAGGDWGNSYPEAPEAPAREARPAAGHDLEMVLL